MKQVHIARKQLTEEKKPESLTQRTDSDWRRYEQRVLSLE